MEQPDFVDEANSEVVSGRMECQAIGTLSNGVCVLVFFCDLELLGDFTFESGVVPDSESRVELADGHE